MERRRALIQQKALTQPFAVPSTNDCTKATDAFTRVGRTGPGARNWKHKIDYNSKDHSPFKKRSIVVPGRGTLGRTK